MFRNLISSVILAGTLLSSIYNQQAKADALQDSLRQVDEVRLAATFNLGILLQKPERRWILATTKPDLQSGKVIIHSFFIDGTSGKTVRTDQSDIMMVKGDLKVLSTLTGEAAAENGSYDWKIPVKLFYSGDKRNSPTPRELYVPFNINSTIIFPLEDDLKDPAKALPTYPIPIQWQNFVLPAWKYYQANPGLFQLQDVVKNQKKLQQLLKNANPLLAVSACRTLATGRLLDETFINDALAKTTELKQAAFIYWFLGQSKPILQEIAPVKNEPLDVLLETIDEAKNTEPFQGIALGALTGLRNLDHSGKVRAFQVLDALDKKQATLANGLGANKNIAAILNMASLPLLRQNARYNSDLIK